MIFAHLCETQDFQSYEWIRYILDRYIEKGVCQTFIVMISEYGTHFPSTKIFNISIPTSPLTPNKPWLIDVVLFWSNTFLHLYHKKHYIVVFYSGVVGIKKCSQYLITQAYRKVICHLLSRHAERIEKDRGDTWFVYQRSRVNLQRQEKEWKDSNRWNKWRETSVISWFFFLYIYIFLISYT